MFSGAGRRSIFIMLLCWLGVFRVILMFMESFIALPMFVTITRTANESRLTVICCGMNVISEYPLLLASMMYSGLSQGTTLSAGSPTKVNSIAVSFTPSEVGLTLRLCSIAFVMHFPMGCA